MFRKLPFLKVLLSGRLIDEIIFLLLLDILVIMSLGGFSISLGLIHVSSHNLRNPILLLVFFLTLKFSLDSKFRQSVFRFIERNNHSVIIGLILAGAFALRAWPCNWGFSTRLLYPENYWVHAAAVMFRDYSLEPPFYHHPSLFLYVLFGMQVLYHFLIDPTTPGIVPNGFYPFMRILMAAFSTLSVYMIYRIGSEIYSRTTGIIAALFLSVIFIEVRYAHFIKEDSLAVMLTLVSFYLIYKVFETGSYKYYILSGIFIGLSIATKYHVGLLAVSLFLAHFLRYGKSPQSTLLHISIGILFIPIGFSVGSPYHLLKLQKFLADLFVEYEGFLHPKVINSSPPDFLIYLFSHGISPGIAFLSIMGVLMLLRKPKLKDLLSLSFPLLGFIIYNHLVTNMDLSPPARYHMPLIPFTALFGAVFLDKALNYLCSRFGVSKTIRKTMLIGFTIVIISFPLAKIAQFNSLITRESPLTQAAEWIKENVGDKEALAITVPQSPWFNQLNVILSGDLRIIKDKDYDQLKNLGVGYIVFAGMDVDKTIKSLEEQLKILNEEDATLYGNIITNYYSILGKCVLVKEFYHIGADEIYDRFGHQDNYESPIVRIYKLSP